jgi:hypothetical protein
MTVRTSSNNRISVSFSSVVSAATLGGVILVAGCKSDCQPTGGDHCADIPAGAVPHPNGTYACQWQQAHMAAAEADELVFYHYEFENCGPALGPFGQRHLAKTAQRLAYEGSTVVLERSEDANLDQARVKSLVDGLASLGIADAQERVVVGNSRAEGMYGIEASTVTAGYAGDGAGGGGSRAPFGGQRGNLRGAFGGSLSGVR